MRSGGLFAGYGGLDMAVTEVFGAQPAWFSEIEPGPSKILEHHWPDVPNHGDITTIDWDTVEPVEILSGGFPCQDISPAGKRAGLKPGTRSGLWNYMAYAVGRLRPRYVVIENVRGLLSAEAHSDVEPCPWCLGDGPGEPALRALGAVLADLGELGYDARWIGLPASDVGAPHGRFRVFVVAYPQNLGYERPGSAWRRRPGSEDSGSTPADASSIGRREGWPESTGQLGRPDAPVAGDEAAAHTNSDGLAQLGRKLTQRCDVDGRGSTHIAWGDYEPAIRRWERILGRPAPHPRQLNIAGTGEQLAPVFSEWMMGLPAGWVTGVPGLSRNEQLHALGNGVVPQQAMAALLHMATALIEETQP